MGTVLRSGKARGETRAYSRHTLTRRFDSEHRPVGVAPPGTFLGGDVDIPVRPLLNIADANRKLPQQRLAPLGLRRLVEGNALELLSIECSHEEIVLPGGELVSGIKHDARRTDR